MSLLIKDIKFSLLLHYLLNIFFPFLTLNNLTFYVINTLYTNFYYWIVLFIFYLYTTSFNLN